MVGPTGRRGHSGAMVGDPDQIRAVAARLRSEAERVQWLAHRVLRTGDVAWRSPAADLYRWRVAERAHALRHCAEELDTAALLVDVHGQAVSAARTELARAGTAVVGGLGALGGRGALGGLSGWVAGRRG